MSDPGIASHRVFHTDLDRFNQQFRDLDAVCTGQDPDGTSFQWIDDTKVPAQLLDAYSGLLTYGYANGLI